MEEVGDNLSPETHLGDINLTVIRRKSVLDQSSILMDTHIPCLWAEGHTAHTSSALPRSPAACSQSAATPAVTKNNVQSYKCKNVYAKITPLLV